MKPVHKFALLTVFLAVSFLASFSSVSAATYYVSGSGNDNNPGTQQSPWRTIQKAADTMAAGDVVEILSGNYNENVEIYRSGTNQNPITYQGNSGAYLTGIVEINADNITFGYMDITGNIWIEGSDNIIQTNYIHDSWEDDGISTSASPRDGTQSQRNIIRNNRIERVVKAGLYIEGRDHIIESNDISRTQDHPPDNSYTTDADGIRFFGTGHRFRWNYVHDIYQSDMIGLPHIDTMQTWEVAYDIRFDSNVFHNPNPTGSNRILMLENQESPVRDITWVNNVFIFSDDSSSFLNFNRKSGQGTISNMVVVNNTFYSPNGPRDKAASFQNITNATFKNNNLINATDGNDYVEVSGGATASVSNNAVYNTSGSLSGGSPYSNDVWMQNPQVRDLSALDFHLNSNSPLIDAGVNHNYAEQDKDGYPRINYGSAYDIGAYEYNLTPTNTPAASVTPGPTQTPVSTPTQSPQPTTTSTPLPTATQSVPGDADGNGQVDGIDYVVWLNKYGENVNEGALEGDFDNSGFVDGLDYVIWLNNYTG